MTSIALATILYGIFGGLIRGVVGIAKYLEKNKKEKKLRWGYFIFSLMVAGFIGAIAGAILKDVGWEIALVAGYAGTDFLESLYKIRAKQGFEI
ncbi:MAG: hypothetical protein ABH833_02425 [Parcubacteria group bacterium]